jgi:hypothetical protein
MPCCVILPLQDNGRDKIGNDSPDCEFNRIPANSPSVLARPNATTPRSIPNFGHPYCHTQGLGDPFVRDFGGGEPLLDPEFNPAGSVVNCSGMHSVPQTSAVCAGS